MPCVTICARRLGPEAILLYTNDASEPGRALPRSITGEGKKDAWQWMQVVVNQDMPTWEKILSDASKYPWVKPYDFRDVVDEDMHLRGLQSFAENWDKWEMAHATPPDDPQTYQDGDGRAVELHLQPALHRVLAPTTGCLPHEVGAGDHAALFAQRKRNERRQRRDPGVFRLRRGAGRTVLDDGRSAGRGLRRSVLPWFAHRQQQQTRFPAVRAAIPCGVSGAARAAQLGRAGRGLRSGGRCAGDPRPRNTERMWRS